MRSLKHYSHVSADQRLGYRYTSTIPLLSKFEASIFCGCLILPVPDRVGNPEVRFSRDSRKELKLGQLIHG